MKKKITSIVLSLVLVLSMSLGNVVFAEQGITVKLNGETLSFDVPPQVINERTMVPMRVIFEALGAIVAWEGDSVITSIKEDTLVGVIIGRPEITVNGVAKTLDVAPCVIDNRTLVPVRAISEAYGMNVVWDAKTKTVLITGKKQTEDVVSSDKIVDNLDENTYNRLKNIIISKGKIEDNGSYVIYNFSSSTPLSLTYDPIKEEITLFSYDDEFVETGVLIHIYPNKSPSLYYEEEYSSGRKYYIIADYLEKNKPAIEKSNTFPIDFNYGYDMLYLIMSMMDTSMQDSVGMTFADFGLYYEN